MARKNVPAAELCQMDSPATGENVNSKLHRIVERRSFLKTAGIAGATLAAGGLLTLDLKAQNPSALEGPEEGSGSLAPGDAAILRFLAAAEIIESDLWLQYAELGGVQDNELPTLASQLIPGYPSQPTGGNPIYTRALQQLADARAHRLVRGSVRFRHRTRLSRGGSSHSTTPRAPVPTPPRRAAPRCCGR